MNQEQRLAFKVFSVVLLLGVLLGSLVTELINVLTK